MKSLSRRNVDDEGGRKPAKDGPGLQVDGPRAWVWHLSVAGAEERGQAGMSATRSAARAGGGRECGGQVTTVFLWTSSPPQRSATFSMVSSLMIGEPGGVSSQTRFTSVRLAKERAQHDAVPHDALVTVHVSSEPQSHLPTFARLGRPIVAHRFPPDVGGQSPMAITARNCASVPRADLKRRGASDESAKTSEGAVGVLHACVAGIMAMRNYVKLVEHMSQCRELTRVFRFAFR